MNLLDSSHEGLLGDRHELLHLGRYVSAKKGPRAVAVVAIKKYRDVDVNNVAVFEGAVVRDPMADDLVH